MNKLICEYCGNFLKEEDDLIFTTSGQIKNTKFFCSYKCQKKYKKLVK